MSFRATYAGKRIFLTGHTGFKGSWLAAWLLKLGAHVTGFSKDVPTQPALYEVLGLSGQINDLRGDITDLRTLTRCLAEARPDVVFHLAAQPLVRFSYDHPAQTFQENVIGTANLLESLRIYGNARAAVIVTTDKVYENKGWEYGYRETDRLGGYDPYSASKAGAEIVANSYIRSFFQDGTRICTARAGNVIGGGDWALDRLVPDCVRAWDQGRPAEIRNPTHTRPWEHVLEPLGGYLQLGKFLINAPAGVHGEAFNFGPDSRIARPVIDLVEEMAKNWPGASYQVSGKLQGSLKKEASSLHLNCERAASRLGWKSTLSFEETIAWTVGWYRSFSESANFAEVTQRQIDEFQNRLQFETDS